MSAIEVEARLRAIMQSWQLPIEPGCEQHLAQLINQAALRVEADGFAADPLKLWEAETNFRKLLTEMTLQAGAMGFANFMNQHSLTLLPSFVQFGRSVEDRYG